MVSTPPKVFKDVHNVVYDSGDAITGIGSINQTNSGRVISQRSDAGTFTRSVISGDITGTITFLDAIQAALLANKVAADKNLMFDATDEAGAVGTWTLTKFKSAGFTAAFGNATPSSATVSYGADALTGPV